MTINAKTLAKWLAVMGAVASAVIGSVGVGTLPNAVRVALVILGAVVVAVERALSTGPTTPVAVNVHPVVPMPVTPPTNPSLAVKNPPTT